MKKFKVLKILLSDLVYQFNRYYAMLPEFRRNKSAFFCSGPGPLHASR